MQSSDGVPCSCDFISDWETDDGTVGFTQKWS